MTRSDAAADAWQGSATLYGPIERANGRIAQAARFLSAKTALTLGALAVVVTAATVSIAGPPEAGSPEAFRDHWNAVSGRSDWVLPFHENHGKWDLWTNLQDHYLRLRLDDDKITHADVSADDGQVMGSRCVRLIEVALGWPADRARAAASAALDDNVRYATDHPDLPSFVGYYREGGIAISYEISASAKFSGECAVETAPAK